jgi:hypothetical protein
MRRRKGERKSKEKKESKGKRESTRRFLLGFLGAGWCFVALESRLKLAGCYCF